MSENENTATAVMSILFGKDWMNSMTSNDYPEYNPTHHFNVGYDYIGKYNGERYQVEIRNIHITAFKAMDSIENVELMPSSTLDDESIVTYTIAKKSAEELDKLKRNWIPDPHWDIEQTWGFEAHYGELNAWRESYKSGQNAEAEAMKRQRAAQHPRIKTLEHLLSSDGIDFSDETQKGNIEITVLLNDGWQVEKVDHVLNTEGGVVAMMRYTTLTRR